jgi:SAM-dependent methyltransferase
VATLQTFGDVLALLHGDLETFRYPVLDLAERHGERYRRDAVFILRKLEELVAGNGETLEGALELYRRYVESVLKERQQPPRREDGPAVDALLEDPGFQRSYLQTLALSTVLNRSRYELFLDYRRSLAEHCRQGISILEIGAGNCLDAAYACAFGRVVAFERNEQSRLWQRLLGLEGRVDLRIGRYGFEDPPVFDLVVMIELLEHLPDPAGFLRGAFRVLKDGGLAYLTFALRMPQIDHLQDFTSIEECRALVAESGFALVREHCLIDTYQDFDEEERWALAQDSSHAAIWCCLCRKRTASTDGWLDQFNEEDDTFEVTGPS